MIEWRTVVIVLGVAVCATAAAIFKVLDTALISLLGGCLTMWFGKKLLDSPGKSNGTQG